MSVYGKHGTNVPFARMAAYPPIVAIQRCNLTTALGIERKSEMGAEAVVGKIVWSDRFVPGAVIPESI